MVCPDDLPPNSGPIRMCVGCRQRAAKAELLRVVVHQGLVLPDPAARAAGRGAHLHPTVQCLMEAERRRAFPRALRVAAGLDIERLRDYLQALPSSTTVTETKQEH